MRTEQSAVKMLLGILYNRRTWKFFVCMKVRGRSQRTRGLRHELSSPARVLESWVRITLDAWMSL
jgi:hypothetical protein